jgi:hypothetical protein
VQVQKDHADVRQHLRDLRSGKKGRKSMQKISRDLDKELANKITHAIHQSVIQTMTGYDMIRYKIMTANINKKRPYLSLQQTHEIMRNIK